MTMRFMAEKTLTRANRKIPEDYRPTEDEPFMSNRQRAYFRRKLLAWRDEILRSTKETRSICMRNLRSTPILRIERARRLSAPWNCALAIVSAS